MEASFSRRSLRSFGKAIQCISRVSDELYLNFAEDEVHLRTVNQARSCFVAFDFRRPFFDKLRTSGVRAAAAEAAATPQASQSCFTCKLLSRTLNPIFRCLVK